MTNKIKNIASKYGYPLITGINTFPFTQAFITLLTPAATPLTAFCAVFTGIVSVMGWLSIAYEYQVAKVRAEAKTNVLEMNKNKVK